jgi:hypothetical protein
VEGAYPGTKVALTEYNWGGLEHINGALAQADVLGIFGREGLELATLWAPPEAGQPGAFAFRMYRNYDGAGGRFGDLSLHSSSGDQGQLSVYAARRSGDEAVTVMVVNKSGRPLESQVELAGLGEGVVQVWRYSPAELGAIVREADQAVGADGSFTALFPADSITLLVSYPK